MIDLGSEVRDVITGFTGIAVARQDSLFETPSIKVQSRTLNGDGRPMDAIWFEESRLELKAVGVPVRERADGL